MLPTTIDVTGRPRRRNGSTAAGWLRVNGT
jgi:hypothetical protein